MKKMWVICIIMVLALAAALLTLTSCSDKKTDELISAIHAKDTERVEELLKQGVNPNKKQSGNIFQQQGAVYPFHEAIKVSDNDNYDMVKLFVKYGADVNQYFYDGVYTPLWCTMSKSNSEIFFYLIDNGADINKYSMELIYGSVTWNLEILEYLLENGVSIDAQDKNGFTALADKCNTKDFYEYSEEGKLKYLDTIKILLDNGADKNLKNKKGKSAYDYAVDNNLTEILELFEKY